EESPETGSPGFIVYGYDGILMHPIAPSSPDYVLGPEHPPSPDYMPDPKHPPSPVEIPYVPELEYPEYLLPSDAEAPLEDHHLPADASPTYADYPVDEGDDDDPSDDDDDDDTNDEDEEPFEDEEDDDEEKEHLALADSSGVPIVDHVFLAGDIEAFETDESEPKPGLPRTIIPFSQIRLCRARKTVRLEPPMSASMKACIARHDALLLPPLHVSMRALLPSISHMTDIPEADVPHQMRACLTTPSSRFEVGESSAAGAARQPGPIESDLRRYRVEQIGYEITDTWDEIVDTLIEITPNTSKGVNQRVTELDTTVRQRTDEYE
nr:hypothetical protein [Tanacetum cinerariifolium]